MSDWWIVCHTIATFALGFMFGVLYTLYRIIL